MALQPKNWKMNACFYVLPDLVIFEDVYPKLSRSVCLASFV